MEAPMRRDFEALDRSEMAAARAEAREWERLVAEAAAGREKYRGVKKVPSGRYAADIRDPETGKQVWLGTYDSALVAACAYDLTARSLQGDRARPNFAYPPPPALVSAVAAAPRRRGHSYRERCIPPPLARALANAPAAFLPHPNPYPYPHVPGTARARIVPRAQVAASEAESTVVHSIKPAPRSSHATAATCCRVNDPSVNHFAPPMHMVAPASSVKTCFSFAAGGDSASSSTGESFTEVPPSSRMPIDLNGAP